MVAIPPPMTAKADQVRARILALEKSAAAVDRDKTVELLKELVPTYDPEAAAFLTLGS
jgi:hypothetical protein